MVHSAQPELVSKTGFQFRRRTALGVCSTACRRCAVDSTESSRQGGSYSRQSTAGAVESHSTTPTNTLSSLLKVKPPNLIWVWHVFREFEESEVECGTRQTDNFFAREVCGRDFVIGRQLGWRRSPHFQSFRGVGRIWSQGLLVWTLCREHRAHMSVNGSTRQQKQVRFFLVTSELSARGQL